MAELESVGHSWGLCRDTDFPWEWQVPIQHMPRGSGKRQHPCPSPGPDQGGSIQLLKTTVGRKGKARQKGQMSPRGFYHQPDGNELRAAVLRASYPEGNTRENGSIPGISEAWIISRALSHLRVRGRR